MNYSQKIILVEDNQFDYQFVKMALDEASFKGELIWCPSGQHFLDHIATHSVQEVSFILMDMKMPGLSGLETLAKLKSSFLSAIPIIMFSASKHEQDVRRSRELGARAYVSKPVKFDDFSEAIRSIWKFWGQLDEITLMRVDERSGIRA